ncbi:aromatic ring-hydroxylating dioxygenase subunit alpha [Alphaproteobacteria bacterium]|nr:aromatic ring-hydroxylating dioxygenase subunit alpha [Alphaproteobacteria bacterium]
MKNIDINQSSQQDVFTPDRQQLERCIKPINDARGIPNDYYIRQESFELEGEHLFNKGWFAIGFGKDLPQAGSVKPVNYFKNPLLLIRSSQDKKIRVFQNVCRHRGMVLIEEPTILKGAIRCPYHSWCYKQTGEVVATPHIGGPGYNYHSGIDKSELSLIEVRSHIWRDVIFVNPDGAAPPFEEVHKPLLDRWATFNQPMFSDMSDSSFHLDVNTNWKLAVENYLESYHLPWIHPGLNSYSKLEDHENIVEYGHYAGQISNKYLPRYSTGKQFREFQNLGSEWNSKGEYIVLFPNLILGVQKDHVFNLIIEPLGPSQIKENIEIYYSDPSMLSDEYKQTRQENAKLWKTVFEEDIFVVEGMQKGRYAQGFDGGRFSPVMDGPTHVFHDWYARQILNTL